MSSSIEILNEIKRISASHGQSSTESAREFYNSGRLPELLKVHFFEEQSLTRSEVANRLGMSTTSLRRVLTDYSISENMLFRVQNYFTTNLAQEKEWFIISSSKAQEIVTALSSQLDQLYSIVKMNNSLGLESSALSPIQKAQLISMLEAMIAMLRAPAVSKKQTKTFFDWLTFALKKGAEKGIEKQISNGMESAIATGHELITHLDSLPGANNLSDLF